VSKYIRLLGAKLRHEFNPNETIQDFLLQVHDQLVHQQIRLEPPLLNALNSIPTETHPTFRDTLMNWLTELVNDEEVRDRELNRIRNKPETEKII